MLPCVCCTYKLVVGTHDNHEEKVLSDLWLFFFATYRMQVLQAFQNDASVKVLLISLKAGGVALNLTVANHIFLMDP